MKEQYVFMKLQILEIIYRLFIGSLNVAMVHERYSIHTMNKCYLKMDHTLYYNVYN